ncbi:MAG TPA: 2-succinyl-5-enolpyruvyl-6-hydroxy-3-cyclohexene-1-carboxylic-acid synthase [Rariglobus sp.]|jgi:2-succinyl-5-enolpyruvyl-6-hydroxy-3-cyclohexene-1-carboxylate synthase|nr:2-succinyl-5-enolpyruvyl-6-hydroxy-3-cyclohexene-1-carboxylic-acid synthase [Rariglobus sp.]
MPILDFRNTNSLWCSVLVETLVRSGVAQAVVSPGSRSTPLTMALTRHPQIEAIPVLDERSAGFFALGLAKQHRRPTVLVCTSGTAGANYFPAVIEAQESGVPLLVITADRPPEMRDCASGQTIDQQKLFGGFVEFYHELAVPESKVELLRYLRQTIAHAATRARRGPVHLNAPFRDPLPPIKDATAKDLETELGEDFFAHLNTLDVAVTQTTLWQRPTTARGLIFAGTDAPADPAAYVKKVGELAEGLGWPVLADVLSPVRHLAAFPVVTAYDTILRNAAVARDLAPRTVLCLGGWPTSKVLRGWMEASGAEVLLVASDEANRDALHGRTRQITAPVESLAVSGNKIPGDGYVAAWLEAETKAASGLGAGLANETAFVEPKVTATLAENLPAGTPLFVANSMPVRDLEYFWPASTRGVQIHFSRGANGIDGTLSTALGVAHGNRPTVLLTGDLALLHDTNGFLSAQHFRGSLTIVLINNNGGGIFDHLPVAQFNPPFEKFWATPQDVNFGKLCAAYGVAHTVTRDGGQLAEAVAKLPESGVRVLEVLTDRKRDAAFRKKLFADVAATLK